MDAKEALVRNNFAPPKRTRSHQVYVPTDQDRKIAYSYSAYGATREDIANVLGVCINTVVNHFEEELEVGRSTAKTKIAQKLYNIAIGRDAVINEDGEVIAPEIKPNLSALIFLAKTRLGWKETAVIEQNLQVSAGVKIYLPDNGMRAEEDRDGE